MAHTDFDGHEEDDDCWQDCVFRRAPRKVRNRCHCLQAWTPICCLRTGDCLHFRNAGPKDLRSAMLRLKRVNAVIATFFLPAGLFPDQIKMPLRFAVEP